MGYSAGICETTTVMLPQGETVLRMICNTLVAVTPSTSVNIRLLAFTAARKPG
jgi:hypothetical protein